MRAVYLKNFRKGLATNSSSTHSVIYRNEGELFNDLDIFEYDYYDRCTRTIAASKEAKIKYILAGIMYNEPLVKIMSSLYPEMKQYFPKIKDSMEKTISDYYEDDTSFGMCCRGELSFANNIEASVDYLKNIIEDPEIIIVGGSDEEDFVYDTTKGHIQCPEPWRVDGLGTKFKKKGITKNGNYWVGYGHTGDHIVARNDGESEDEYGYEQIKNSFAGRLRFATEKDIDLVPEYPELIDLKITNMCDHGCKFCFMDSNMKGKHADFNFLSTIITHLGDANNGGHRVEFSIGGGNILLYPQLEKLCKAIHARGHIVNVTIRVEDCEKILKNKEYSAIFDNYIDGIGVSIENVDDADKLVNFIKAINDKRDYYDKKYIAAHLIPEYIGIEMAKSISEYLYALDDIYVPQLYLGYKENGRGASQKHVEFTKDELDNLFKGNYWVSIDTTFANRYLWWIKDNFSTKNTITTIEGEFSMYIDGVTQNAYKSSYQLDKPYNMHIDYRKIKTVPFYNVREAFAKIRHDNGLKSYDEVKTHYWD